MENFSELYCLSDLAFAQKVLLQWQTRSSRVGKRHVVRKLSPFRCPPTLASDSVLSFHCQLLVPYRCPVSHLYVTLSLIVSGGKRFLAISHTAGELKLIKFFIPPDLELTPILVREFDSPFSFKE